MCIKYQAERQPYDVTKIVFIMLFETYGKLNDEWSKTPTVKFKYIHLDPSTKTSQMARCSLSLVLMIFSKKREEKMNGVQDKIAVLANFRPLLQY